MATDGELLASVVSDFDVLYRAYEQAGLLADQAGTETAKKLLGSGEDVYRFKRQFLLVDAVLRNRVGRMVFGGDGLRHVAVFGGNNVGKSTVTNILAAEKLSSTSPEGGHTRHSQAFLAPSAARNGRRLFGDNPFPFGRFKKVPVSALDKNRLDEFGEGTLSAGVLAGDVVLWDMPDCDATESRQYMGAVVEAVSWADTVVYVTSVERYAVEHMVEWLFCLDNAGIGVVECINKTRRKDIAAVIENQRTTHFPSMAKRLGLAAPDPPIVGLRYLTEGEEEDLWGPDHPEADLLRKATLETLAKSNHAEAGLKALGLALRSINELVEPAKMEAMAKQEWATAVEGALKDFASVYERQYLRSDKVIEPFTRLNLEILSLLDPQLPGLNEALQALRWITRWPAKLVLAAGRRVIKIALNGNQDANQEEKLAPEFKAYADAHKVVLNRLGALIDRATSAPRHHPFWNALSAAWTEELEPLSQHLGKLVERHMTETENDIKKAAKEIRAKLEEHPMLLRTLRGARVTANVTGALVGFLVPVKGGIVYDLIEELLLAPAIVGSVEAATTGAVEGFVSNCKQELVQKLMLDARTIGAQLYREPLQAIADTAMQKTGTLGISKDVVERLPVALRQLQELLLVVGC